MTCDGKIILTELQQWLLQHARSYLDDPSGISAATLDSLLKASLEQQQHWRKRSRSRFPDPQRWLWTDRSLAQASDWYTARWKSQLFPLDDLVVDGCCGAGVDSVALALRGPTLSVDHDPWLVALAENNAREHGCKIQAVCEPLTLDSLRGAQWLHVDPDRRNQEGRVHQAELFSPSLEEIIALLQRVRGGIIKLAPSTLFSPTSSQWIDRQCSRIWVGVGRECRQQVLVYGQSRTILSERLGQGSVDPGDSATRTAVLLAQDQDAGPQYFSDHYRADVSSDCDLTSPKNYLYDLHTVLHAADLQIAWARINQLEAIGGSHGYFTGSALVGSPWVQPFELVDEIAWDDRKVRKWLRAHDIGQVEVKCRLVNLDASAFQRRYSGQGSSAITLLVTRIGQRVRCLACRRMVSNSSTGFRELPSSIGD